SGTYVSSILPEALLQVAGTPGARSSPQRAKKPRVSAYARRAKLFAGFEIRPSRAFRANVPALNLFPTALWAQITARPPRRASQLALLGCRPMGVGPPPG